MDPAHTVLYGLFLCSSDRRLCRVSLAHGTFKPQLELSYDRAGSIKRSDPGKIHRPVSDDRFHPDLDRHPVFCLRKARRSARSDAASLYLLAVSRLYRKSWDHCAVLTAFHGHPQFFRSGHPCPVRQHRKSWHGCKGCRLFLALCAYDARNEREFRYG